MTETRPLAAALSILTAMLVIGFIDNFVVVIAETGGLWQFHLVRTAMSLPIFLAMSALGLGILRPNRWWGVIGRSFFTGTAMILYFGALAFLPVAEVAAGLFTAPIWVLILSVAFFGHRVGAVRIAASLVGFAGVLMVLRPDAGSLTPMVAMPLAAGAFYAVGAIATREWCEGEGTLALLAGNFLVLAAWGVLGIVVLAITAPEVPAGPDGFLLRGWVVPSGPFLFWTLVQAVGSSLGVWFLIRGYQLAEASFVSVFEYSLLIFIASWAFVLRGETVDVWSVAGIVLIIASGTVLALRGRQ